jgi:hypothetical protein
MWTPTKNYNKNEQCGPQQKTGSELTNGKKFMFLIRHPPPRSQLL